MALKSDYLLLESILAILDMTGVESPSNVYNTSHPSSTSTVPWMNHSP